MRPVSVFAKGPGSEIDQVREDLQGRWRQATRAVMVLLSAWVYRLGRRCAADFIALLDQLLQAFPSAPVIAVICDNDSIHHRRALDQPMAAAGLRTELLECRFPSCPVAFRRSSSPLGLAAAAFLVRIAGCLPPVEV